MLIKTHRVVKRNIRRHIFWDYCQSKALASLNVKTLGHFKISVHQRSTDFELLSTKDKRMKYDKKIFARRSVRDLQETNIRTCYTTLCQGFGTYKITCFLKLSVAPNLCEDSVVIKRTSWLYCSFEESVQQNGVAMPGTQPFAIV